MHMLSVSKSTLVNQMQLEHFVRCQQSVVSRCQTGCKIALSGHIRTFAQDVRQLYRDQFLRLLDDLDAARTPASTPVASPARALPFAAQATLASEVDAA